MVGYNCTGKAAGIIDVDLDMDVNIHASVPDSVKPGEEFTIEESYTDIELDLVDQNVVKETANPLEGNVSKFDLEFDNAVETESGDDVINMVEEGEELEFGPIDFADDAESVGFTVPEGDKLSVDLTAGESGDVEVTAGEIKNTVYANHALIGDIDVDVTCIPRDGEDTHLNTIPIEDDGNGGDPEPNPEEEALDAVNEADDAEEMQEALNNDDLGLDLSEFDELTEAEQAEVANQMLENRPGEGFTDANAVKVALEEAISEVTEEPEEPGNGDNPEEEALQAVNEAETVDELWDALENEDLELNLSNTENYNTYRKTKAAEHIMENQPEGGYTVGYSESSDDDYEESVQKAVNNAHSLFLPASDEEKAFNAVNDAENAEDMQGALQNEDLGLNVEEYNQLSDDEKAEVAETVLDNRPDDDEGYPLPEDIQLALDNAVEAVEEDENGQGGEDGEDGQDGEDGEDGQDGQDGEDGEDGQDGKDGEDGKDGKDGSNGDDGKDGKDNSGYKKDNQSSSGTVTKSDNNNGSGGSLPDTATTNPLFILFGSVMAVGGGALVFIRRKIMG